MTRLLAAARSSALHSVGLVLVPVGSMEQHGPHLPLSTDAVIAQAVATRIAELLGGDDVLVAPTVVYGASGEHQKFPGTSSVGTEVLRLTLVELTRSMRTWARRVVFVNAHGGNLAALTAAVEQLVAEGHDVGWVPCAVEGADAHAGSTETSLMMFLNPWMVRSDLAEAGNTSPLAELLPALRTGGVGAVSANGVLGDPTGASAQQGKQLLEQMASRVLPQVTAAPRT